MPSHKKLENLPVSVSILSPEVTVESYTHYLGLMHDVVADAEANIFPALNNLVPDLHARNKRMQLEADLVHSGTAKPDFKKVFCSGNFSEPFALGVLYVIEGSSLGGRFILNNISSTLGFDADNGARYFSGYGNKTGQMWKSFLQTLTDYEARAGNSDEIIAGADYAFRAIHEHFSLYSRYED